MKRAIRWAQTNTPRLAYAVALSPATPTAFVGLTDGPLLGLTMARAFWRRLLDQFGAHLTTIRSCAGKGRFVLRAHFCRHRGSRACAGSSSKGRFGLAHGRATGQRNFAIVRL